MERPTCKTCPYWDVTQDDTEERPSGDEITENGYQFDCRRHAPTSATFERLDNRPSDGPVSHVTIWPITQFYEWCGEHPDFPAYVASLKPPESTGNSVLDNILKTVEKY